jgi:putative membrane protein insertion efficiency factor
MVRKSLYSCGFNRYDGDMIGLYDRLIGFGLRAYKLILSPLIGQQCRFQPTCSQYAAAVLIGHGPLRGSALAFKRICRCRPGVPWGYDPPPPGARGARIAMRDGLEAKPKWKCDE